MEMKHEHELRVRLRLESSDGLIRGTELDLGTVKARTKASKTADGYTLSVDLMALKGQLAVVLREAADDMDQIRSEDLPGPLDV